ncbi:hypothetical protein FNV43_RR15313 [Rhamnella rubrinervis]|uniref:Stress up-regulated Nod 19 n=1 Tax=Rhamnella rubrinervis TaxID=2594499 RepID=A0A8K0GWP5_9ROSA|nr:hypothetical protein FNV43_RR15313 [Rhamnella rubrinervis]
MLESSRVGFIFSVILLLALSIPCSCSRLKSVARTKSAVFLSPKIVLEPGSVSNKLYYGIDFPRGHIALKDFIAEVVDEAGNPIPLYETYLHHWVVERYYGSKHNDSDFILVANSGLCQTDVLRQYYGLGSETRRTATHVPDPFGIEVGNAAEIPSGYEEKWLLNVHAIDTRGAEDTLGCTECRCDLYNVTKDESGQPLKPDYIGGLSCCYDETRCRVREGFQGANRTLYLSYTVTWVDWSDFIVPVKIYILDVTDTWKALNDSNVKSTEHQCKIEYDVKESCTPTGTSNSTCIDSQRTSLSLPSGGYMVYGVAHQHTGGIGSTLYRKDGRVLCSSLPIYGTGNEAGNEAGYIVGMSTCYPHPGSVKIIGGETLILESNYNSTRTHTGVMGLFYILVADQVPPL